MNYDQEIERLEALAKANEERAINAEQALVTMTIQFANAQNKLQTMPRPPLPQPRQTRTFQTTFEEPNPRLPFVITIGALGTFAFCTFFYFWMQLKPAAPLLANPNPPQVTKSK